MRMLDCAASQNSVFLSRRPVDPYAKFPGICCVPPTVLYGLGRISRNVGSLRKFLVRFIDQWLRQVMGCD